MVKPPLLLVTDFGSNGPYLGQMQIALSALAPDHEVINLISDAPLMQPKAAAYLLAALADVIPSQSVFVVVVDPGVGGPRSGVVLQTEHHWYVGPDNGLLAIAAKGASHSKLWRIEDKPKTRYKTFHGRDLFAPVAALVAKEQWVPGSELSLSGMVGADWDADLLEIIYIDHYGNAFTGIRAASLDKTVKIEVGGMLLSYATTFCDVEPGCGFWYENSCGLVELAVNQGRADRLLRVKPGDKITIVDGDH